MKKVYKIEEIDCANCARKIEEAVNKLDCVETAKLSFMTEKLTVVYKESEEKDLVKKAIKGVSSDASLK